MSNKKTGRARKGKKSNKGSPKALVTTSSWVPRPNYSAVHTLGVTPTLRRTLVYSNWATPVSVGAGAFNEATAVLLNNAYAPDNSFFSSSANGYNRYMNFYSKCYVKGARLRVDFSLTASPFGTPAVPNYGPIVVGVTIATNSNPFSSFAAAVDAGLVQYKTIGISPNIASFTIGVDLAKFLGVKDILDLAGAYSSVSASISTIYTCYAHLWIQSLGQAFAVPYTVELEMDCVFTDPVPFT